MVSYLTVHYSEVDSVLSTALKDGSVAAAIRCIVEPSMSSAIVLALTDLCVAKEWNTCTGRLLSKLMTCFIRGGDKQYNKKQKTKKDAEATYSECQVL